MRDFPSHMERDVLMFNVPLRLVAYLRVALTRMAGSHDAPRSAGLALTRRGLPPDTIRQAVLSAITLGLRGALQGKKPRTTQKRALSTVRSESSIGAFAFDSGNPPKINLSPFFPLPFFPSAPGAVLTPKLAEWCETNIPNLKMVDIGVGAHFLQESHPHLLGPEIARWYHSLGA